MKEVVFIFLFKKNKKSQHTFSQPSFLKLVQVMEEICKGKKTGHGNHRPTIRKTAEGEEGAKRV